MPTLTLTKYSKLLQNFQIIHLQTGYTMKKAWLYFSLNKWLLVKKTYDNRKLNDIAIRHQVIRLFFTEKPNIDNVLFVYKKTTRAMAKFCAMASMHR